jgi:hypothetical protein
MVRSAEHRSCAYNLCTVPQKRQGRKTDIGANGGIAPQYEALFAFFDCWLRRGAGIFFRNP